MLQWEQTNTYHKMTNHPVNPHDRVFARIRGPPTGGGYVQYLQGSPPHFGQSVPVQFSGL